MEFDQVGNQKGRGKKRKPCIKRNKVFQIALKGEENGNFAGRNLNHSKLL